MSATNKTPVPTNLIKQNCYIKTATMSIDTHSPYVQKKYYELQRKTVANGIIEELVEVDYPISPDTVKSYADSADYRRDPFGAVASATPRKNLGDITEAQKASQIDTEMAKEIYNKVLADVKQKLAEQKQESKHEPKQEAIHE